MFHEMRRNDRALTKEETLTVLENGEYGILSTCGEDGYPYGVPVSYAFDGEKIWFHGAREGHKTENMVYNSRVSFCVVGNTEVLPEKFSTRYESVIVFGMVRQCEGEEKIEGLMKLVGKYSKDFTEKGLKYAQASQAKANVCCIEIGHMTGKSRRK